MTDSAHLPSSGTVDDVLMVSISGIRGRCQGHFTPELVETAVRAFVQYQLDPATLASRDAQATPHPGCLADAWLAVIPATVASTTTGPGAGLQACGQLRPLFVLGHDGRPCNEASFVGPAREAIVQQGADVVDLGAVPTPTVQLMVQYYGASGGVVLTASHNPTGWAGLKFVASDGLFLKTPALKQVVAQAGLGLGTQRVGLHAAPDLSASPDTSATNPGTLHWGVVPEHPAHTLPESRQAMEAFAQAFPATSGPALEPRGLGLLASAAERSLHARRVHIGTLLCCPAIDVHKIRARQFPVVLDTVNAAGCLVLRELLEALGCRVSQLYGGLTGVFGRAPEPIPAHLATISKAMNTKQAFLGIAVDPDADRCVLADGSGTVLSEEWTLALAVAGWRLSQPAGALKPAPVVINLSTSSLVQHALGDPRCPIIRTPVGEIHVTSEIGRVHAEVGGEGNGGVILRWLHLGRDSLVAAALVLTWLAHADLDPRPVSASTLREYPRPIPWSQTLLSTFPPLVIVKAKVPLPTKDKGSTIRQNERLLKLFSQDRTPTVNRQDGLRLEDPHWGWIHIRASNTEPIVRIIAEAGAKLPQWLLKDPCVPQTARESPDTHAPRSVQLAAAKARTRALVSAAQMCFLQNPDVIS